MSAPKASRLRHRLQIDPDAPGPVPVAPATETPVGAPQPEPRRARTTRGATALDDPAILEGRNGYRSFYIEDSIFARFRSAIYWLARREDAMDQVPPNMSAAVEEFMRQTTEDLERRFNEGEIFRATPDQLKPRRTKQPRK